MGEPEDLNGNCEPRPDCGTGRHAGDRCAARGLRRRSASTPTLNCVRNGLAASTTRGPVLRRECMFDGLDGHLGGGNLAPARPRQTTRSTARAWACTDGMSGVTERDMPTDTNSRHPGSGARSARHSEVPARAGLAHYLLGTLVPHPRESSAEAFPPVTLGAGRCDGHALPFAHRRQGIPA